MTNKLELGILLIATAALTLFFRFSSGVLFNPDSFYHLGCAELYAQKGWLSDFPWLKYTVLGESFPNVHFLQHIFFAPFTLIFSKILLLKIAPVFTTLLLAASIYLTLKRWNVPYAHLWTFLGILCSPLMLAYLTVLKGGSLFFVFLVFYIDSLYRQKHRSTLIITWLSVYTYVGAPVLILLAALFSITTSLLDKKIQLKPLLMTGIGLVCGLLINPFTPENIFHIERELMSPFNKPDYLKPGVFMGSEWVTLSVKKILSATLPVLILWFIIICASLKKSKANSQAIALFVCTFGLFGAGLFVGTKILFLFLLLSCLSLPLIITKNSLLNKTSATVLISLACLNGGLTGIYTHGMDKNRNRPTPRDFQIIASELAERSDHGEVVVAPWDDFPGLFYFNKKNHYVVGMNPSFLRDADKKRFRAYFLLFQGKVKDPENLISQIFDGAKKIVVRSKPRTKGEQALNTRLKANKAFNEIKSKSRFWSIFEMNSVNLN